MTEEQPILFKCKGEDLVGILHLPDNYTNCGILIVVGGPQTRVGSHRQFVLLARYLADNDFPVMRFDYRAMGDSSGEGVNFDSVDEDIESAIDIFIQKTPGIDSIMILGLCDAASAALFYAYRDTRVKGMVLLNPWVRTEHGKARTYIKHYYLQRFFSLNFWKKVFSLKWNILESLHSFAGMFHKMIVKEDNKGTVGNNENLSLPDKMLLGLKKFDGNVLFILSGNDYVADEFLDLVNSSEEWSTLLNVGHIQSKKLEDANHTFSKEIWRNQVEKWTLGWLNDHC